MSIPSQSPARLTSGMTTDQPWQALGNYGFRNPFFYHEIEDDFDWTLTTSGWTQTKTGNGTIAHTAGDGGLALFTTNSSAPAGTDICSIQMPAADFSITLGKKMFFLAKLQLSSATNAAFLAGLIQTTATPFTVTDGVYFLKPTGALNNLVCNHAVGSTITSTAINTAAYLLANATNIEVSWYIDRQGNINMSVGQPLVGYDLVGAAGTQRSRQPVNILYNASITGGLTTATLNPTIAIQSGTAASSTMTVDFIMAAKER